jgi:hypothetical protein
MWQITSQKNGISALGLQRVLGLGSYKTAWAMLHKLRRAMVRPGRDRLDGVVEVDEAYWGGEETGAIGRQTELKTLIIVAAEEDGKSIGRIRLHTIPDASSTSLHGFIRQAITSVSYVHIDNLTSSCSRSTKIVKRGIRSFRVGQNGVSRYRCACDPALVALLRAHIEEVVRGDVFGGSPRSQQFLRHVVDNSLHGEFGPRWSP